MKKKQTSDWEIVEMRLNIPMHEHMNEILKAFLFGIIMGALITTSIAMMIFI